MKKLTLTYAEKEYVLEYNRRIIGVMENRGFRINELTERPETMVRMLINGAFMMHHSGIKTKLVEEIYDSITSKKSFLAALVEMYNEQLTSLIGTDEPDEEEEGNQNWTANW